MTDNALKRAVAICLLTTVSFIPFRGRAQFGYSGPTTTALKGQPCPPFSFSDVDYYVKSTLDLADLKGKPAIIDFFGSWCAVCFESFPKLAKLRDQFEDQMKFVLVGRLDSVVKTVYKRFDERYHLNFPVAYDSNIFNTWQIVTAPYDVWVDEFGIVQAVTTASDITEANIKAFLAHQSINAPVNMNIAQRRDNPLNMDWTKPFLVHGNGGEDTDFIYRSLLSDWRPGQDDACPSAMYHVLGNRIQALGTPLSKLYQIAYADTNSFASPISLSENRFINHYGQWALQPELAVSDKSLFAYNYDSALNLYNYSLIVPMSRASADYMQKTMQRDLETYFGYTVKIEDREIGCWELHTTPKAYKSLRNKSQVFIRDIDYSQLSFQYIPVSEIISIISSINPKEIFVDKTDINFPIDITITANMTDFEDVKKALEKKGLILVRSKIKVKMVVIKDADVNQ